MTLSQDGDLGTHTCLSRAGYLTRAALNLKQWGINQADWGKIPELLPVWLQVTFLQSSKETTRGTVHQGKGCAGGCARVSPMPGSHCVQKQELSHRGSFPRVHSIACLAPQPNTEQTLCPARTQQCLPCLGSLSTVNYLYSGLLPAFLLCCFFSFFLHLLPKLRFSLVCSPLPFPHCCCSIPS